MGSSMSRDGSRGGTSGGSPSGLTLGSSLGSVCTTTVSQYSDSTCTTLVDNTTSTEFSGVCQVKSDFSAAYKKVTSCTSSAYNVSQYSTTDCSGVATSSVNLAVSTACV